LAGAGRRHSHGALLFVDLDRFKPINDIYGHHTGDRVLQEVARRLVACTRHEDLVGRLGGDEFVILLPHLDVDRLRAATVAQHVLQVISQPFLIDALEISLSPSIGISFYPEHSVDVGGLIHAADLAMYQVKQSGRSSYQFYSPELDRQADEIYSLETRLKDALRHHRLALHYQPVVDIADGRLIGVEALVRLADNGILIGPASFIPVAESTGLIGDIGEWVLWEACRQHELWREEGMRIPIAVNVSPLQFKKHDFAETLKQVLVTTGVDPSCIHLEVTESAVMESLGEAIGILRKVKALGVKIALDDFGTGYSSLSRLASLPLDKLKVDQSFVRQIDSDSASRAVTEAIITLGRKLKLDVVGEGIESEHALRYLQAHGCNQAQGNWFSAPLTASQFTQWHRRHLH
ncbi:MAG TPA: EAL domain-containing protein, partial [Azonexus sp.]|nr:EAL domain-containing protein [Azonexus sp.]